MNQPTSGNVRNTSACNDSQYNSHALLHALTYDSAYKRGAAHLREAGTFPMEKIQKFDHPDYLNLIPEGVSAKTSV